MTTTYDIPDIDKIVEKYATMRRREEHCNMCGEDRVENKHQNCPNRAGNLPHAWFVSSELLSRTEAIKLAVEEALAQVTPYSN